MSSWKCWPFCLGPNVLNRYDTFSQDYTTLWVLFTEWTTIIALDQWLSTEQATSQYPIQWWLPYENYRLFKCIICSVFTILLLSIFIASIRHMVIKDFIETHCNVIALMPWPLKLPATQLFLWQLFHADNKEVVKTKYHTASPRGILLTSGFPHKGSVTCKAFLSHDVIMNLPHFAIIPNFHPGNLVWGPCCLWVNATLLVGNPTLSGERSSCALICDCLALSICWPSEWNSRSKNASNKFVIQNTNRIPRTVSLTLHMLSIFFFNCSIYRRQCKLTNSNITPHAAKPNRLHFLVLKPEYNSRTRSIQWLVFTRSWFLLLPGH